VIVARAWGLHLGLASAAKDRLTDQNVAPMASLANPRGVAVS
jgi:hypothetical protein